MGDFKYWLLSLFLGLLIGFAVATAVFDLPPTDIEGDWLATCQHTRWSDAGMRHEVFTAGVTNLKQLPNGVFKATYLGSGEDVILPSVCRYEREGKG